MKYTNGIWCIGLYIVEMQWYKYSGCLQLIFCSLIVKYTVITNILFGVNTVEYNCVAILFSPVQDKMVYVY